MKTEKRRVGRPKKDVTLDKKQEIRCAEDDKLLWQAVAEKKGFSSTSEWARAVLNKSAKASK